MDAIGAQEVLLPALLPKEPYEATGRWEEYGDLLFRLQDRKGGDYLLGPTHEEIFTQMVKDQCIVLQGPAGDPLPDPDEVPRRGPPPRRHAARPRVPDEGLVLLRHRPTRASPSPTRCTARPTSKIFERLGLDYRIVSAVSGAMGGSASEEFLAPAAAGEDTFVDCPNCDYAANTEAVTFALAAGRTRRAPGAVEELDTPDTPTIETLAAHLGVPASATLKNLLVKVDGEIVAVGVPGDREVDLGKLGRAPRARPSSSWSPPRTSWAAPTWYAATSARRAWRRSATSPTRASRPAPPGSPAPTRPDTHAKNVVAGRDFEVDEYLDVVVVEEGDPCPKCGTGLKLDRAIEIGHIFQLGRKYADAFQLDVLGQQGKPVRVTMGSYGIGVSRAVAALAEQTADDKGLCWPARDRPGRRPRRRRGQGPPDRAGPRRLREAAAPRACASWSTTAPASRPGVKFTDAELIGVPKILVAGRRSAEGVLELKDRRTGEREELTVDEAIARLTADLG